MKGRFISIWDEGVVSTNAELDTDTGEIITNSIDVGNDFNNLISEEFEDENGDMYDVCPECHEYILKTVMVDGIGSTLEEIEVCSNSECVYNE